MTVSPGSWRDPKNLLLLAVVLAACIGVGEFTLRQLPLTDRLGFQQVADVAERAAAAGPREPGQVRILGIGDSFTVFRDAQGKNYLRIAASLAADKGKTISVVNLGEAGVGLDAYARNLIRFADTVKPDVVVIGLYFGDDLLPHGRKSVRERYAEGNLLQPDIRPGETGILHDLKSIAKKSILLNYVYRQAKVYIPALRSNYFEIAFGYLAKQSGLTVAEARSRMAEVDPELVDLARADAINGWDLAFAICMPRLYLDTYTLPEDSKSRLKLDERLDDLSFIIAEARKSGIKPVVVYLHPGIVVAARYRTYFRKLGYAMPPMDVERYKIIDQVSAHLNALGVPHLDSLPLLRASTTDDYIPNDIHLNSKGQSIVGGALFQMLDQSGLLDGS